MGLPFLVMVNYAFGYVDYYVACSIRMTRLIHVLCAYGLLQKDTGLGEKRGGNTEGAPKKDFGAIPFFLVITDYEKAFMYVDLG